MSATVTLTVWALTPSETGIDVDYEPHGPNAYFAADADTLTPWLRAGHRVTMPQDTALLERVIARIESG